MEQRSSAPARALAAIALVCGFLVVIVVVGPRWAAVGTERLRRRSERGRHDAATAPSAKRQTPDYVVQNGDTLTSIAHETGVSVARIEALNPGVDPQVLVSGEKLKLR